METVESKSLHPLMWMVGISVIVFSLLGIGALLGWIPTTFGNAGDKALAENPAPAPALAEKASSAPVRAAAPKPYKSPAPIASTASAKATCINCGVIESTRVINAPGETSVVGVVGGAVVGGVLGNQIGGGRGKDLATVAGAVGGAVAGNQIEKRMKTTQRYETTVRFDDGSTKVFSATSPQPWKNGERVQVIDGVIRAHS